MWKQEFDAAKPEGVWCVTALNYDPGQDAAIAMALAGLALWQLVKPARRRG